MKERGDVCCHHPCFKRKSLIKIYIKKRLCLFWNIHFYIKLLLFLFFCGGVLQAFTPFVKNSLIFINNLVCVFTKKNIPPEFGGIFDYMRSVCLFSVVYICHNGFGLLSFALLSHSHPQPHLPDGSNNG